MKKLSSFLLVLVAFMLTLSANAQVVNARIKGVVTDPSGAAVPAVTVVAANQATGVKFNTKSSGDGTYVFQQLPIGTYSISAEASGFKGFKANGITLNIDQEYVEPIQLTLGNANEVIEVKADSVQVNTTDSQLNNIVDSHQITELPLIGRGFTGLEQILPGVQASSDRFGSFSVNGSQSQQSAYVINGADSNDLPLNTVAINPNIDALSQFNLVTGPLNAEYDRNGGGIVNTAIKQGTNHIHGDAFEFYRDTFLNTRNYFQKANPTPKFHQNIFGGTVGGPALRDKLFFFGAYQGIRQIVPQGGGSVNTFTPAQLAGNFQNFLDPNVKTRPCFPSQATKANPCSTDGNFRANVIPGTINIAGCTLPGETFAQCAFDLNGNIPTGAYNTISTNLVSKFVPLPAAGGNSFTFTPTVSTKADQEIGRVDFNPTSRDQVYGVGIFQKTLTSETLPFTGSTLPGFGDTNTTNIHQFSVGYTRQLSTSLVNDFELHYTRFNFDAVEPQQVVAPSTFGFSINPQNTAAQSLPTIAIAKSSALGAGFTLGFSTNGPQPRIDSVYQADETVSKLFGSHNLKFGYDGRKYTVRNPFFSRNSGSFGFNNTNGDSSGDAGLDFLLGVPATYLQGSGARIDAFAFLNYFFAQDTWKATSNLTISYGVGWQIDTQLHNRQFGGEGITCFIPGQQSKIFATAPKNLNYPGDPGCNDASGATTRYSDFGPRFGFAYAPDLGVLSGGSGAKKLSIRGGYGIYYNRSEEETSLQNLSAPPFGQNSNGAVDSGATNPSFADPYIDLNTGAKFANKFPFTPPAQGTSPSFSTYLPLTLSEVSPSFRAPYSENFQLTIEREFPAQTVARFSYVGTLGRHNQITTEGNPITQAGHDACLADPVCSSPSIRPLQAQRFPTHTQFGFADPAINNRSDFNGIGIISTEGSSNYNSFQASVDKGLTHGLQMQASYTFSHSLDDGSSFENSGFGGVRGYNQFVKSLNYGNSNFDARHRFVVAPIYTVPFRHGSSAFSPINLALSGWQVSAIATFATGFPFDIYNGSGSSLSLFCANSNSFYACPDVPNQTGPIILGNPRTFFVAANGQKTNNTTYFTPANFVLEDVGTFGNESRNKYHGPGINNTNLILAKNFSVSGDGSRYIQLRAESDNVFNHTQFSNPTASITSGAFGQISSAAAGRQTQLAAKIYF
ncbi:MAG: carboxypeptidase-like regulatory domain-containing protein [Edaphobacter sp.]